VDSAQSSGDARLGGGADEEGPVDWPGLHRVLAVVCRMCDQMLFMMVEWARGARFFRELKVPAHAQNDIFKKIIFMYVDRLGGSVAEWLACWTQAQKGLGSNRSRDAVG